MSSSQMFSSTGPGAVSATGRAPRPWRNGDGESASVEVIFPSKNIGGPGATQPVGPARGRVADTLDAVVTSRSIRTAVIGAGPRGTSVLERLLANRAAAGSAGTLHIDVIAPSPAGPGHVWQPGQSRLYLMNTQSFYPTIVPEDPEL